MAPVTHLTGRRVIDRRGARVGTVSDVLSDDRTLEPRWAVVTYGIVDQHHRLMPVSRLYSASEESGADDRVVSMVEKDIVRHAPKYRGAPPSRETEQELREYYGEAAAR